MTELATNMLSVPKRRRLPGRRQTLVVAVVVAALLIAVVVAGAPLAPAAAQTDFLQKNLPPSFEHPFGTDWLGRDMFERTLAGLSTSMLVGLGAACASGIIAVILGTIAALGGKRADYVISLATDLMMGIPHIVLLILISYALGKGFWGVTVGIALTHWPSLARIMRAEILQVKEAPYVQVARKLGVSRLHIAVSHMLPHILPQLIVGLVLMFPHAILHEAAITFLGFGLSPEGAAIGVILSESMSYLSAGMWWLAVFPGLALVIVVMLFDVVGTRLRLLIDPAHAQD